MSLNLFNDFVMTDWAEIMSDVYKEPFYDRLNRIVANEYATRTIYPSPIRQVFEAFNLCSYADTKVVIVGQDPYINPGQAHGLSFSVLPGAKIPPSLMNIFFEIREEYGCPIPNNGCLRPWAEQGVLLLNSVLTVRAHASNSHKGIGWETFTDRVMMKLNDHPRSLVFMLWGNKAKQKASMIDPQRHLILKAPHPSPLAGGGFRGCGHFLKANNYLYEIGPDNIDWQIPDVNQVSK